MCRHCEQRHHRRCCCLCCSSAVSVVRSIASRLLRCHRRRHRCCLGLPARLARTRGVVSDHQSAKSQEKHKDCLSKDRSCQSQTTGAQNCDAPARPRIVDRDAKLLDCSCPDARTGGRATVSSRSIVAPLAVSSLVSPTGTVKFARLKRLSFRSLASSIGGLEISRCHLQSAC